MATNSIEKQAVAAATWPERLGPKTWSLYKRVLEQTRSCGMQFAVGGGIAAMTYAGQWRDTKDLDVYLVRRDAERLARVLEKLGLHDYYEKQAYDRAWIYRAYSEDTIIDLIWGMPNQRAQVDQSWFRGPAVAPDGVPFCLLAPEELLWSKLYVLQRDRCDWPDTLNVLYGVGPDLDFRHLLRNLASDAALLSGVLRVFGWLCARRARELPAWLWDELGLKAPMDEGTDDQVRERARLLDSRPWFTPTLDA